MIHTLLYLRESPNHYRKTLLECFYGVSIRNFRPRKVRSLQINNDEVSTAKSAGDTHASNLESVFFRPYLANTRRHVHSFIL